MGRGWGERAAHLLSGRVQLGRGKGSLPEENNRGTLFVELCVYSSMHHLRKYVHLQKEMRTFRFFFCFAFILAIFLSVGK